MRSLRTQFPRVPAPIPRSRAISTTGLRVSRTIRTAPALNSESYLRRVCDIAPPHRRCLHDSGGYPPNATNNTSSKSRLDKHRSIIVDTFIAWSDEILGWHHTQRASNGRIEGTNNLLQVLRRTAHGFTNPANFEARGLLIT